MTDNQNTAYVIYKCAHGWCMEPFEIVPRKMIYGPQTDMYAFTTLRELLEFLCDKEEPAAAGTAEAYPGPPPIEDAIKKVIEKVSKY